MQQSPLKNLARHRERWQEFEDTDDASGRRAWRAQSAKARKSPLREEIARAAQEDRHWRGSEKPR